MATSTSATLAESATNRCTRGLQLWHLLSLDAPTIATVWTYFVARSTRVDLPQSSLISMFLAVWMLYAADRILDARHLFSNPPHIQDLEARHLFHHRHAAVFLPAILACSIVLAILLPHLDPEAIRLYAILAALLFGWFLLIHARDFATHRRLPKELAVGVFFPAAVFIPTIARRPDLRVPLIPPALLFAAVCSLNCLSIYAWEHSHPHTSAHWTTRLSTRYLRALAAAITIAGLVLTVFCLVVHAGFWPLAAAASLSAASLLLLDLNHRRIASLTLRASADLVLLTPLLLLPFMR